MPLQNGTRAEKASDAKIVKSYSGLVPHKVP
jgi:hypothetical protein